MQHDKMSTLYSWHLHDCRHEQNEIPSTILQDDSSVVAFISVIIFSNTYRIKTSHFFLTVGLLGNLLNLQSDVLLWCVQSTTKQHTMMNQ